MTRKPPPMPIGPGRTGPAHPLAFLRRKPVVTAGEMPPR